MQANYQTAEIIRPLLLVREAASALSISSEQVYALVDAGALHGVPISNAPEREHLRITGLSVSHKVRGLKPPTLEEYGKSWCFRTEKQSLRLDEFSAALRCTSRHGRNLAPKDAAFSVSDERNPARGHQRVATTSAASFITERLKRRNFLQ